MNTSRRFLLSFSLLFLVAWGQGQAQEVAPLPQISVSVPVTEATDGSFYGVSSAPFGNDGSGSLFKLSTAGVVTRLATFLPSDYDSTPNGVGPSSPLLLDEGNFYGMTGGGAKYRLGTIFRMSPTGTLKVLHQFGSVSKDGGGSDAEGYTGLTVGPKGVLYGTTGQGGFTVPLGTCGTIFKMTLTGTYTVLHRFQDGSVTGDGVTPNSPMILGLDGNFYGTTYSGGFGLTSEGFDGGGIVYKMTPAGTLTVLHRFYDGSVANDGYTPCGGLVQGKDGSLYGMTKSGGSAIKGTIYKMTTAGKVTILHSFGDGSVPYDATAPVSALVKGPDGDFYGSSNTGGFNSTGTVFRVTTAGVVTILHSFEAQYAQTTVGYNPVGGLTLGTDGVLYGGTSQGITYSPTTFGESYIVGTLFKLPLGPVISSGSTAAFNVGRANSFTVAAGGTSPTFKVTGLPSWAKFNPATGVLSGTPPNTTGMPFKLVISVSNGFGPHVTQKFTLTVQTAAVAPLFTNGPATATAGVDVPYRFNFQGSGSPPPAYSIATGSLPPGLTLTPGGVLSGTPTKGGVYRGTVQAANVKAPAATQKFTITVNQPTVITSAPPPSPKLGVAYSFTYKTAGYPAATNFFADELPSGIKLSSKGVLSGTVTSTGTYSGTVYASNGIGKAAAQDYKFVVGTRPAITEGLPDVDLPALIPFSFTYKYTGYPAPTFTLKSGTLPPGLTLDPSGLVSGTPTKAGTFAGSVTAGNGFGANVAKTFKITVLANPIQQYTILHNFGDGTVKNDGARPTAPLVDGRDGNFYGLCTNTYSGGTVFKITPGGTETILHQFGSVANDGDAPCALVLATDGNFYGVAEYGGSTIPAGTSGDGIAFKITPSGTYTILHSFGGTPTDPNAPDPIAPISLLQGTDGNFYGLSSVAGVDNPGAIFRMTPAGVVTRFGNIPGIPNCLVQGPDGNLYGTTVQGPFNGDNGFGSGTLFRVTPGNAGTAGGAITYLHNFNDGSVTDDGDSPSGLIVGKDGNLYGTTTYGGAADNGTVFKATTAGVVTIVHSFGTGAINRDGGQPTGLYQATDGNFYGMTYAGGVGSEGTAYRLSPGGAYTLLYAFGTVPYDASFSMQSFIEGVDGFLYGPTQEGGKENTGTIIKFSVGMTPPVAATFTNAKVVHFPIGVAGAFAVTVKASPPAVLYNISGVPSWAAFNPVTGLLTGTPPNKTGSPFTVSMVAFNGFGKAATLTLTVDVP